MSGKSVRGETAMRRGDGCGAVASAAVFASTYQCGEARAASFDCAKASGIVETLILHEHQPFGRWTTKLAAAYLAARLQSANPQQLMLEERAWIADAKSSVKQQPVSLKPTLSGSRRLKGGLRTVAAKPRRSAQSKSAEYAASPPWDQLKAYSRAREDRP